MNPAILSGQTSIVITFLASFLIWLMFAGLLFLWIIDGRVKKEQALHALFSALLAWVFVEMMKSLLPSLRPFQINHFPPMTLTIPSDGSFPSGHSAAAFALAASIWLHNKKLGLVFSIMAILVAWSRVAGNVHYTLDVIFGGCIGVVISYLVEKLHLFKLIKK